MKSNQLGLGTLVLFCGVQVSQAELKSLDTDSITTLRSKNLQEIKKLVVESDSKDLSSKEKLEFVASEFQASSVTKRPPVGLAGLLDNNRPNVNIVDDPIYSNNLKKTILSERGRRGRIFGDGAMPVFRGDYPEVVMVGLLEDFTASGVIVKGDFVLTAAHIWDGEKRTVPSHVWLGRVSPPYQEHHSLRSEGIPLEVMRAYRHENYQWEGDFTNPIANDLLLLQLTPESRRHLVSVATHPSDAEFDSFYNGLSEGTIETVRAVGFGVSRIEAGNPKGLGIKREISLPLASLSAAWGLHRNEDLAAFTEFAGARTLDRSDTCEGDSGGPIFYNWGGNLKLVGITSRAVRRENPSGLECGYGGVYTNLKYYMKWINDSTADLSKWVPVE